MHTPRQMLILCVLLLSGAVAQSVWDPIDAVLLNGISKGVFPGCVALVGNKEGIMYHKAFGNFTYGIPPPNNSNNPPVQLDTMYDMASLSKVTMATTSIAQFYQRGEVSLDTPLISILGEAFSANGKESITILNLLLHNAGFYPDPNPNFDDATFGCPNTASYHPAEDFSCQKRIFQAVLNQTLLNPVGSTYVYSDLSMITMTFVVGYLARTKGYVKQSDLLPNCYQGTQASDQCYYEAYVRKYVISNLNLTNSHFLPPPSLYPVIAPTENDTDYRHEVMQGQVHDENSYAMGGVSGHAGFFSTAADVFTIASKYLFSKPNDPILNATTAAYFIKEYNQTQSSRALGWNTNDPNSFDYGWNQTCGTLSPSTFMHTGFTGTMICGDPTRNIIAVLLTNRVYPTRNGPLIYPTRVAFSSLVQKIVDSMK